MDWSLLSFRNKTYPFLRSELLYRGHVSVRLSMSLLDFED